MTDEDLRHMRDDLHTIRDLLFMVLLAPFFIVALLIKLLVQILFFTGIFCVAAGVTVVDLFAYLTKGGRA
jgi:hypothetical protein